MRWESGEGKSEESDWNTQRRGGGRVRCEGRERKRESGKNGGEAEWIVKWKGKGNV